jgi:hypothetical protein
MKTTDFIKESVQIADDAQAMHRDHEVQMAREECYHIAQNAIELHKLLKNVAEANGIDGWASEKISIANDYVRTVREWLEYELMSGQQPQLGENASAGATGSASIGGAAMPLLFGKKKIVKRKKS